MLYIFLVDTGTMLPLDMNLAMESVSNLQQAITRAYHIPPDKQVLLISGGESLDANARVCSYSAGTDTNPIFLFSKSTIESAQPPSPSVNYGSDADMKEQVEGSLLMLPTYETVVSRAQLALQFDEVAKDLFRSCQKLVHDQHLQHQGWAAVIANLEDITNAFKRRAELFQTNFTEFLGSREKYTHIIDDFHARLTILAKTPIISSLLPEEDEHGVMTVSQQPKTLLDWIIAQDPRGNIEQMVEQAASAIEQFNQSILDTIALEVQEVVGKVDNPSMKEVKGLEDRLSGLEHLLHGARRVVQEQEDMAHGFVQNQNRASNLRDNSILPDLCNSHKKQLKVMLKNHQQLRDTKRKCTLAKEELSINLHTRLRWIMYVEKSICDCDTKLVINHDHLKKLKRRLEIMQQMYEAPIVYTSAVVETVRRKKFSQEFSQWSGALSEASSELRKTELAKRDQFTTYLTRHFLQTLFPGFTDKPPPFASEPPPAFDASLPEITEQDIELLKQELGNVPEIAEILSTPETAFDCVKRLSVLSEGLTAAMTYSNSDIEVINERSPPRQTDIDSDQGQEPSNQDEQIADELQKTDIVDHKLELSLPTEKTNEGKSTEANIGADKTEAVNIPSAPVEENIAVSPLDTTDMEFISAAYGSDNDEIEVLPVSPETKNNEEGEASPATPQDVDLESIDFKTADFYIDDSMPSSATESSPNSKAILDRLADAQKLLQQKTLSVERLENDLQESQIARKEIQDKFKNLKDVSEKGIHKLKNEVLSIEKQVQKDSSIFQEFVLNVTERVNDSIRYFTAHQLSCFESELESERNKFQKQEEELEEKLEVETSKVTDAQAEVDMYRAKVTELTQESDNMKVDFDLKFETLKDQQHREIEENTKKLMLEHELEIENVRTELQDVITTKEKNCTDLELAVKQKDEQIADFEKEKAKLNLKLNEQFQSEKDEIVKVLGEEHEKKLSDLENEKQALIAKHAEEIADIRKEHSGQMETASAQMKEEQEKSQTEALAQLTTELETKHANIIQSLETKLSTENQNALEALKNDLELKHENELGTLKNEFEQEKQELQNKLTQLDEKTLQSAPSATFRPEDFISLEEHGKIISDIKEGFEKQQADKVQEALAAQAKAHEDEMHKLIEKFEKNRQDSLNTLTQSNQVAFNEAVTKVTLEKDKVIEDLGRTITDLKQELEKDRDTIQRLTSETLDPDLEKDRALMQSQEWERQARSKVRELEAKLSTLQEQKASEKISEQAVMAESVVPVSESDTNLSTSSSAVAVKYDEMQQVLIAKDAEISKLQEKVTELSMSASTRTVVQDKVSITTCNIGDIVLLCLDDRHGQYVVFTVGTTLYFLHSDSLDGLGLKTGSDPEARKSWVLAQVTDKEYCQAKKPHNRFRVPQGTKFYRVKAVPWTKEPTSPVKPGTSTE